jgi:ribose/xylose/arabinose/galactoside ABC-type transport system permease subunit
VPQWLCSASAVRALFRLRRSRTAGFLPGRFNPWEAIVAVYFLATGINGLTMLGIPLWVTNVFNGGALFLAVSVSQLSHEATVG